MVRSYPMDRSDIPLSAKTPIRDVGRSISAEMHSFLTLGTPRFSFARLNAIGTEKQISESLAQSQRDPTPSAMLFTVVRHMAALTKGLQISWPVDGGIMIEVSGRQNHLGDPDGRVVGGQSEAGQSAPTPVAPGPVLLVPPTTVAQVPDIAAMRPAAYLAAALRSLEPDQCRQLRPVDRIKPSMARLDWHQRGWTGISAAGPASRVLSAAMGRSL